tara:strand:- start:553 stop:819 length:267 start_codon:yes stop_codon:yes gene_type:complete
MTNISNTDLTNEWISKPLNLSAKQVEGYFETFIEYCDDFYALLEPTAGFTKEDFIKGTQEYLKTLSENRVYGGGDSDDRARVKEIITS